MEDEYKMYGKSPLESILERIEFEVELRALLIENNITWF